MDISTYIMSVREFNSIRTEENPFNVGRHADLGSPYKALNKHGQWILYTGDQMYVISIYGAEKEEKSRC